MKKELFYGTIAPLYVDALSVREQVFTIEQGFAAEIDADSIDAYAWHALFYDGTKPIATARLYNTYREKAYSIGRVAVLAPYRAQGLGAEIMTLLLKHASMETKHRRVLVHAQETAIPFYEKLGFFVKSERFLEDGMNHVCMELNLAIRGFEIAKGFEALPVILPKRQTSGSAGYDLALIEQTTIPPKTSILAKTGLKAYMLEDEVLEIYSRSSIALKHNVWCANSVGVIDADYYSNPDNDGHIMIPLYNANEKAVTFEQGQRVAQGIFKKYLSVDHEVATQFATRGGGFGSTGKQ